MAGGRSCSCATVRLAYSPVVDMVLGESQDKTEKHSKHKDILNGPARIPDIAQQERSELIEVIC